MQNLISPEGETVIAADAAVKTLKANGYTDPNQKKTAKTKDTEES